MENTYLSTKNLSIGYDKKILLSHLNIQIKSGEMVCLLGPNGVGKSTLIKTLTNMHPPLAGSVFITKKNNEALNVNKVTALELARHISIVLTDQLPPSNFTVKDIVSLGRVPHTNWLGNLSLADQSFVIEAMEKVNITPFSNRLIDSLSDGEKQRVMFAKALAQDTDLIILDEPTAHLDVVHRAELLSLLKKLARETNKGILISTHELEMAIQAADNVWLINNHKELTVSSPEDLVLSGIFSKTFNGDQIYFNEDNGAFKIQNKAKQAVHLTGEGKRFYWTKHALEKRHYFATNEKAAIRVIIKKESWTLIKEDKTTECTSISELMRHLHRLSLLRYL